MYNYETFREFPGLVRSIPKISRVSQYQLIGSCSFRNPVLIYSATKQIVARPVTTVYMTICVYMQPKILIPNALALARLKNRTQLTNPSLDCEGKRAPIISAKIEQRKYIFKASTTLNFDGWLVVCLFGARNRNSRGHIATVLACTSIA